MVMIYLTFDLLFFLHLLRIIINLEVLLDASDKLVAFFHFLGLCNILTVILGIKEPYGPGRVLVALLLVLHYDLVELLNVLIRLRLGLCLRLIIFFEDDSQQVFRPPLGLVIEGNIGHRLSPARHCDTTTAVLIADLSHAV